MNMPPEIAPKLHQQLPDDIDFTKKQDAIKEPKEFDYDYLLIMTKFTVPNEQVQQQGAHKPENRLFYHWEDQVLEKAADHSFHYLSTFKEVAEDGTSSFV